MSNIKAFILAAGYGKRLMPLTQFLPKCLMPINGYPLLGYWLSKLEEIGVEDVCINVHYQPEIVATYLSDYRGKCNIKILFEDKLLGTAGALKENYDLVKDSTILLIHGDNWSMCDVKNFINHHSKKSETCPISMMTFNTNEPSQCGIVEKDSGGVVTGFYEKVLLPPGNEANAAIYLIEPLVTKYIYDTEDCFDFSVDLIPNFINRISCWFNSSTHRDIGTIQNLIRAQFDGACNQNIYGGSDKWLSAYRSNPAFLEVERLTLSLKNSLGNDEKI